VPCFEKAKVCPDGQGTDYKSAPAWGILLEGAKIFPGKKWQLSSKSLILLSM